MSSMRNIIISVVLVAAAVYGGLKGYIYYKVASAVEALNHSLLMIGDLSYGGITTSLRGSIAINDIKFHVRSQDDDIRIRNFRLQTDNLQYLISTASALAERKTPEKFIVYLQGIEMDLHGNMMDEYNRFIGKLQRAIPRTIEHCNGHFLLGPEELRDMGYDSFSANLAVGYEFDKRDEEMRMFIDTVFKDMGEANLTYTIEGIMDPGGSGFLVGSTPRLKKVQLVYRDLSLVTKYKEYCAAAEEKSVEQFIKDQTRQTDDYYALMWGFVPGPGLRTAYGEFLEKPQEINITVEPSDDFDFTTLHLYHTNDIPIVLNLHTKVNGKSVKDLSFKPVKSSKNLLSVLEASGYGEYLPLFGVPRDMEEKERVYVEDKPRTPPKYHPVKKADVKQHIGRRIKIMTKNNRLRSGILDGVDKTTIFVGQRLSGGRFTMQVPISQVKNIEVYYSLPKTQAKAKIKAKE